MEQMSTIPAPVEAMISGPGSFFGSCQVAANNFEATFQTAMADVSVAQGAANNAQPQGFGVTRMNFDNTKTFSDMLAEVGENKVLENLQAILGEDAGKEAFELALLMAQNDDALGQLSPETQMDVMRLFKIMDMAETSIINIPKVILEDWVKDVKNVFTELKIEFAQPEEEPVSELEKPEKEDLKNIKILAKKIGIKPKDMPKFVAFMNILLKEAISSQDLKEAAEIVPQESENKDWLKLVSEDGSLSEIIKELWEFVKNEPELKTKNLANENIVETEYVPDSEEPPVFDSEEEEEPVPHLSKKNEPISNSPKEPIAKETVFRIVKEILLVSSEEDFSRPLKKDSIDLGEEVSLEFGEDLIATFHALLRKFMRGELTEEEKEKLKHILKVAEHANYKKEETLEEGEEVAVESEESEPQEENAIRPKDPAKENLAFEDLAFEEETDLKMLDSLVGPKKAGKNKRKGFNPEIQMASQTQQPQQTLQTQPRQTQQALQAQAQHTQQQVQPEVRAIWEVDGLRIELVNPKTGEKLQTTHEAVPQRMQERINEFEVIRQVVAQAKFITTPAGEQKMTIQLRPEHLGQMDLRIVLNHGEMQIHARVESATAQSALETHIGLLREGLEKQGITLERLEVSVEQRDRQDAYSLAERQEQREQRHSNRRHHRGREQHLAVSIKNETSDTGRRLGYNTMEYLA